VIIPKFVCASANVVAPVPPPLISIGEGTESTATDQLEPVYTLNTLSVVLKKIAPVCRASPSLSTLGSEAFAPRYKSVNSSSAASAAVALALAPATMSVPVESVIVL
jgi:hypothetical protein